MLEFLFAPLASLSPVLAILVVSASISTLINLCYRFLVDQTKARYIKSRARELQGQMKDLQKKNDVEGMNKMMSEAMKNNAEQMRLMFKPMMVSMLFAILTLPWLNETYSGFSASLPAELPLVGSTLPFGWLGWYLICSIPFMIMTRKLLGVEL